MKATIKLAICACLAITFAFIRSTTGAQLVLEWEAPVAQTDQTVVTNLTGYRVYYGTESGSYDHVLDSVEPYITISNIEGGQRYFFAVAAYTSDNTEGIMSDEVVWDAPSPNASPNLSMSVAAADPEASSIFTLAWSGQAGKTYTVEVSTDLTSWQVASSGQLAVEQSVQTAITDGVLTFCDTDASNAKQRFYRIKIDA